MLIVPMLSFYNLDAFQKSPNVRTKRRNLLYVVNTNYTSDKMLPKDTRFTCSPSTKDLAAPGSTTNSLSLPIDRASSGTA